MAKFNVNDRVTVSATNQEGVVMCREEINDKASKRTEITYLVKLGDGFENYKQFTRKELKRVPRPEIPNTDVVRVYDAPNGVKVTMVAMTDVVDGPIEWSDEGEPIFRKEKLFRLGVSFYNPTDDYDEVQGYKIARHRAIYKPFCSLTARFLGEFNEYTVNAIMDAKARYIIENIDNFVTK